MNTDKFLKARNFLLFNRTDYDKVIREFEWPVFDKFNWAREWFDHYAKNNHDTALWIKKDHHSEIKLSYQELSTRSDQVAGYLQKIGVQQGDKLILFLPNVVATWELMMAAIKIGAIIVPTSILATNTEIQDRITRSGARYIFLEENCIEKLPADLKIHKVLCQGQEKGFLNYAEAYNDPASYREASTNATDPLFLYFTSGTTSKAKLVLHTHQSYPVGHLSTMYWIGIKEKSIHQNISSPGWAKHAWSSFFAPFNAGATSFVHDYARFSASSSMKALDEVGVTSLCAPPTVWRMMILENLGTKPRSLTDITSAGEPLNPEVIEKVEAAWGLRIRDGYGQTETTIQVGNSPEQEIKLGSMGRPMPGYKIVMTNSHSAEVKEGELSIKLDPAPVSLMGGYVDDPAKTAEVMKDGYYRTGDEALVDDDGYIFFVGRGDDVFKSSDYRISPFELESALLEHPMVAEAAVVPSPDDLRTNVPKAFITLKSGINPDEATARDILLFAKDRLPPYNRIRKVEFMELPKTISGKIRRVELRKLEAKRVEGKIKGDFEFILYDFHSGSK